MMDKQALRALIEAVEAAGWGVTNWRNFQDIPAGNSGIPGPILAHRAYHGSLDAAKMLHGQLLPGWWFAIQPTGATVGKMDHPNDGYIFDGGGKIPARAWLIAILKAYEAQQ